MEQIEQSGQIKHIGQIIEIRQTENYSKSNISVHMGQTEQIGQVGQRKQTHQREHKEQIEEVEKHHE